MPGYCANHKGFYKQATCEFCAAKEVQQDSASNSTPSISRPVQPNESALNMIKPVLSQNKTAPNPLNPATSFRHKPTLSPTPVLKQKKEKESETSWRPFPSLSLKKPVNENASTTRLTTSTSSGLQQASSAKETNKSSAVPKEQMDAFIDGLVGLEPSLGFPVFSVCDNNSFHTTGYLWGLYAVKSLKKRQPLDGPVAIINFDSHSDAGTKSSRFVASDRWGGMLVSAIVQEGAPACYLSTFNHPHGTGNHFIAQGGQGVAPSKPTFSQEDLKNNGKVLEIFTNFWANVEDYFGKPIKYVFFTIDRDVLRNSFTQWGDGAINGTAQLQDYMRCALSPLHLMKDSSSEQTTSGSKSTASLIGFDITGLPEAISIIRDPSDGFQVPAFVWKSMEEELMAVRTFVDGLRRPELSPALANVIFFSGSVSYTTKSKFQAPLDKADCWDFISNLSSGLHELLPFGDWRYLLCRQKVPIYHHGWKPFSLYRPEHGLTPGNRNEVMQRLGTATPVGGFACTASVSTPGLVQPKDVPVDDMVQKRGEFAEYHPDIN
ncbi:hypothetical protein JQX13_44855 [Archangium violaceum]|uniref:hypothetical protein n=1 Tax=Archangium violaceum TaxID=83451 RepID=UPI00193AE0DC|nr:hypothetical protein [Archangium violaceum]QRK07111.1 hypothetical protein JQX13_44855 [Archangium violaceum]